MPRIAGVNIPENKQIEVSLSYIYGIGRPLSKRILDQVKVDSKKRAKDLSAEEINKLREVIEKSFKTEGELRHDSVKNIKRLKEIGCWRGVRHIKRLPVRGQRTRTNNRTIRGNVRKTVGSGRKPAAEPT